MKDITTRIPTPSDAAAIARIDAEGLATGHATFRNTPHDWDSFSASFFAERGLALVAEVNNRLVAWAGISPTSARAVYKGVGEVSIYVSANMQGRGIGRHLLNEVIFASEHAGYWTLVSQIFPENEASLSLHKDFGFSVVGTRTKLGRMDYGPFAGRWRDVIMLERRSQSIG
jgi:L-amino acid N-acyltransferase YncA